MSKYRTNLIKGRNGQTVYAVEEQNPETKEWAVLKVFNNRESAETAINKVNKDLNKKFNALYHGTNPN